MKISKTFLKSNLVFYNMQLKLFLLFLLVIPGLSGIAHGHTIDAVGEYRVEIGWMNEPVVSGETNAIEFYVNPLIACPEIPKAPKCAESQKFQNGISDLRKTIKIELVYKDKSIILPLSPDHDIPGKYYGFVNPTISGFYQANILGTIVDTPISLSMHPPKVSERAYIEFPEPSDITITQIIDGHTALIEDVSDLKDSVIVIENSQSSDMTSIGIGFGVIGIAIAIVALVKSNKSN